MDGIPEIQFPATIDNISYLTTYKKNRVYFSVPSGHSQQGAMLIKGGAMGVLFTVRCDGYVKPIEFQGKVYKVTSTQDFGLSISFDIPLTPEQPFMDMVDYIEDNTDRKRALLVTCYADDKEVDYEVRKGSVRESVWGET